MFQQAGPVYAGVGACAGSRRPGPPPSPPLALTESKAAMYCVILLIWITWRRHAQLPSLNLQRPDEQQWDGGIELSSQLAATFFST